MASNYSRVLRLKRSVRESLLLEVFGNFSVEGELRDRLALQRRFLAVVAAICPDASPAALESAIFAVRFIRGLRDRLTDSQMEHFAKNGFFGEDVGAGILADVEHFHKHRAWREEWRTSDRAPLTVSEVEQACNTVVMLSARHEEELHHFAVHGLWPCA